MARKSLTPAPGGKIVTFQLNYYSVIMTKFFLDQIFEEYTRIACDYMSGFVVPSGVHK